MSRIQLTTPRRQKYKNFMQRFGELWINFEDVANDDTLVTSGEGTASEDDVNFLTGSAGVKLSVAGSENYARVRKAFTTPQDVTGKTFMLWFYLHDDMPKDTPGRQAIKVHFGTTFSDFGANPWIRCNPSDDVRTPWNTQISRGFNCLMFNIEDMEIPVGSTFTEADMADINYVYVYCDKETNPPTENATPDYSITADSIYTMQRSRGKFVVTADDCRASDYTEIFEYLYRVHGIPFVFNLISTSVDDVGGEALTSAQITEMVAAGCMAGNHTDISNPLLNLESYDAATGLQHIDACKDFIVANNWGDGLNGAYPQGAYTNELVDLMRAAGYKNWRTVDPRWIPNPHINPTTEHTDIIGYDPLKISSALTLNSDTVEADWDLAFEALRRYGGISTCTIHKVVDDTADPGNVAVGIETDRSVLRAFCDALAKQVKLGYFDAVVWTDVENAK